MALWKNVASQKMAVFAWDTVANEEKTGDAANITARLSKDGGAATATNDTNPTELDATYSPGVYLFDMTQAETNCDLAVLFAKSSSTGIKIEPVIVYTFPTPLGASDISNLDASVSSRLPTASYTAPPSAVSIRTEMDANSSKLANLDAATSSRASAANLATVDTVVDAIKVVTDDLDAMITAQQFTVSALSNAPTGGGGDKIPTSITYNSDGTINVVTFDDLSTWTHVYTGGQLTSITVG